MCNSRENEHLRNTWLPTKHFYIFSVIFFFCELKLYSQGIALITPENCYVGSASSSLKEGGVRKLSRIFSQLHTSMPPRNTRWNDLVFTLPPNISLISRLLFLILFCPNHWKEKEQAWRPARSCACALCFPRVLTRAERTVSQEKGKVRGSWPGI